MYDPVLCVEWVERLLIQCPCDLELGPIRRMHKHARLSMYLYAALAIVGSTLNLWWHWLLPTVREMHGLAPAQWRVVYVMNLSIAGFCFLLGGVGL